MWKTETFVLNNLLPNQKTQETASLQKIELSSLRTKIVF